jgi:O-antigen/teichoic acid export membrane protein
MFVRDSINTIFTRSGAYVLAFLISIAVSNLGQEVKGQVAVIVFVSGLMRIVSIMGYDVAAIYFLRQRKYDYDTIARNLNTLVPLMLAAWTLLLFPLLYYLHTIDLFGDIGFALVCACLAIVPANSLMNIQICFLIGAGEITRANKIGILFNLLYLVFLVITMFLFLRDTWGVIGAYTAAFAISGLAALAMNWGRRSGRSGFEWNVEIIKDMGSWGMRSQAGALARYMTNRVDLFLTNFYGTAFLAGVYSVALNWAELPQFIPGTLVYVLFPHASGREKASSIDLTNRVSRLSVLSLLVMSAAICALFPMVERILYKPDYSEAIYPLIVVVPGLVLKGVFRVLMGGVDGLGKPQYSTYASFAALVSTVTLNVILIPRFGMIGAATASSVTGAVAFFIMTHYYRKVSNARWSDFLIVRKEDIVHTYNSVKRQFPRAGSE